MMVEPCLYCKSDCKVATEGDFSLVFCPICFYQSSEEPQDYKNPAAQSERIAVEKHNRLYRIVQAAAEYVKARQADTGDYAYKGESGFACGKYELLRMAVEGGRSECGMTKP